MNEPDSKRKMHRNADISYSSINAAGHMRARRKGSCFACRNSLKSCFKCCMLRLPYGSITSTLLSICGLVTATVALIQASLICDRILYDLMHRKFLWFSDLKVIYIVISIAVSVIILIDLVIGFATTDQLSTTNELTSRRNCLYCCSPRSTSTSCLMKLIFFVNYLLYYVILACLFVFIIILFICGVLQSLCYHESKTAIVPINEIDAGHHQPHQSPHIDLRLFQHLLKPITAANETDPLYFTGNRLKMLCTDFTATLSMYIILITFGLSLLAIGFFNFLINLSVNWTRLTTQQKCAELVYINTAEMTTFGPSTGDAGNLDHPVLESTTRY